MLFLSVQTIFAAPGDLDTTFNTTGIVTNAISNTNDAANAVAVQSDGKIIAVGSGNNLTQFVLVRYTTSGALDSTFGSGGIVTYIYPNATEMAINAIAIQSDGKIVVAGHIKIPSNFARRFAVARFLTNGTLDWVSITPAVAFGLNNSSINSIAIQSDGKIVATGQAEAFFGTARYDSFGNLDTSFNSTGFVLGFSGPSEGGGSATAIRIQSDGKIVVAGRYQSNSTGVVRYNSDGTPDITFDGDGKVTTAGAGPASAIALHSNGKIVAVTEPALDYSVIRYNANGSLDTTFGTTGIVTTNVGAGDSATGVDLDYMGNIYVTGFTGEPKLGVDIFVSRHTSTGALDPIFDGGGDGIVTTDLGTFLDQANAIALHTDGKIIIAGTLRNATTLDDFAVLRYVGAVPTAANVTLGGRITNSSGGVPGVLVVLAGGSLSQPRVAITSSFGYYNFYDVPVGHIYVVTPESNRYTFAPTNLVISLMDEYLQANFTASSN